MAMSLMIKINTAGAVALGVMALVGSPAVAVTRHLSCLPKHALSLVSTSELRVYELRGEQYACNRVSGKTRKLDRRDSSKAYVFDVRGRYVAYELYVTERESSNILVRTLDTRRSRLIVTAEAFTGSARTGVAPVYSATAMQLGARGAVAWITPRVLDDQFEVRLASAQREQLLDVGEAIEGDSLAVGRRYIYWWNATGRRASW
jgi:hypothetical protein